jgi:hypothetical protein
MVTGIDTPGSSAPVSFGHVVTVLLLARHNDLATHDAYLHLGSTSVSIGQFVKGGDEIGVAGPNPQSAAVGYAFYPGDNYGFGSEWTKYIQTPDNKIDSRLDPTSFLQGLGISAGQQAATTNVANATSAVTGGLAGLNTFFTNITSITPIRVFKVILGTILFIAGIVLAVQQLKPVQLAEKAALAA